MKSTLKKIPSPVTWFYLKGDMDNMTNFGKMGSGMLKTDISVAISKCQNFAKKNTAL